MGRMITKSLSRDQPSPARIPRNPPGAGISVTVANGAAAAGSGPELPPGSPAKRRRVTAEMEGKYVIHLPKGTTARSRKILELQAARGLGRTSVFERLGAEAKAAAAATGKPSGVFSRLGDALDSPDAADPADPADPEALPYAGVLKKRRECSGSGRAAPPEAPPEAQDGAVSSSEPWGCGNVSSSCDPRGARSVFRRLGRKPD